MQGREFLSMVAFDVGDVRTIDINGPTDIVNHHRTV